MVFASTITKQGVAGAERINKGTWATDAAGGNIATGLVQCETMVLQYKSGTIITPANVLTALPAAGSSIAIAVTADTSGYWIAWGY